MRSDRLRRAATLSAVLTLALSVGTSHAQILGVANTDVEGYFGTTSDLFQAAEGPTVPTWPASGPGFYPITGPGNAPSLYPSFPNPVWPVTPNIPFNGGHQILSTPFSDGITTAGYAINTGVTGAGTLTGDAFVDIGLPGAAGMFLNQPPPATGYAYEQVEFAAEFPVGAGGITGNSPAPRPFIVFGNVLPGGYAQFGAEINYWFLDVVPGTTIVNSITFLGSLQYSFQISSVSGPFSTIVNFAPTSLLGATGSGILEITGNAFVTGDPFSITVQQVPEPSTAALLALGLAGLGWYGVRRRKAKAA